MLPDLNNEALKRYGIPELVEHLPELFGDQTDKVVLAIADQGVGLSEDQYTLWRNPDEIPGNEKDDDGNGKPDDVFGWNFIPAGGGSPEFEAAGGHGRTAAIAMTAAFPGGIAVMNLQVASNKTGNQASLYRLYNAAVYAAQNGAKALNVSYGIHDQVGTFLPGVLNYMRTAGCIWLANFAYPDSLPAIWRAEYDNILTSAAIGLDYKLSGAGDPKFCQVGVYAGAPSFAAPVPGGLIAMLKSLDVMLTHQDLIRLVCEGAAHEGGSEKWCEFGIINHKRSVERLLGRSLEAVTVPASAPVSDGGGDEREQEQEQEQVEDTAAPVSDGGGDEQEQEQEQEQDTVAPVTVVKVETRTFLSDGTIKTMETIL